MKLINYKTTLAAILAALPQILHLIFPKQITLDTANLISGIMVSAGLLSAKDNNVTGGTVVNNPNKASVVKEAAQENKP